jgi:hypothetical protein
LMQKTQSDAFIDSLNLEKLGFKHSILADTGRRLACGIVNRNRFGLATENRQQWRFSVALEASVDCLLSLLVWCMLCLIGCGRCGWINRRPPIGFWIDKAPPTAAVAGSLNRIKIVYCIDGAGGGEELVFYFELYRAIIYLPWNSRLWVDYIVGCVDKPYSKFWRRGLSGLSICSFSTNHVWKSYYQNRK